MAADENALTQNTPRETSGSQTFSRYEYQKHWAMGLLLDSFTRRDDFAILLDYHDDVGLVDSETSPSSCDFYQIKTKEAGNWKIRGLLRRSGPDSFSIIGKLSHHRKVMGDFAAHLTLVSNAALDAILTNEASSLRTRHVKFSILDDEMRQEIAQSLSAELGMADSESTLEALSYLRSELSLTGYKDQTRGRLVDFFEEVAPQGIAQVNSVYRVLSDEFARKTSNDLAYLGWEELKMQKALTRSSFERLIDGIARPTPEEKYDLAIRRLERENLDIKLLFQLQSRSRSIEVEISHGGRRALSKAADIVERGVAQAVDSLSSSTLVDFLRELSEHLRSENSELLAIDDVSLYLLILRSVNV